MIASKNVLHALPQGERFRPKLLPVTGTDGAFLLMDYPSIVSFFEQIFRVFPLIVGMYLQQTIRDFLRVDPSATLT